MKKPLPSTDAIKALFDNLPHNPKERRDAIIRVVNEVAKEAAADLKSLEPAPTEPTAQSTNTSPSPLIEALLPALPKDYADRLRVLEGASRASRDELVISLLSALDAYLATHEPQENPRIKNPIDQRKDLVRQKSELAEEVTGVFERLGLKLCCPSGKVGNLKVFATESNTKGQYRLTPRGTGRPEVAKANLRDVLPSFRFEGSDIYLEPSEKQTEKRPSPSMTGRGRGRER
jgi:hypothetical protein